VDFSLQYLLLDRRDDMGAGVTLDVYAGGRYSYEKELHVDFCEAALQGA
jgi:hypothetical protein